MGGFQKTTCSSGTSHFPVEKVKYYREKSIQRTCTRVVSKICTNTRVRAARMHDAAVGKNKTVRARRARRMRDRPTPLANASGNGQYPDIMQVSDSYTCNNYSYSSTCAQ
jgi:hypothetical protein